MLNGPYVVGVGVFEEKERSDLRQVWDSRFIFISAGRLRRGISQPAETVVIHVCSYVRLNTDDTVLSSPQFDTVHQTQPYGQGD